MWLLPVLDRLSRLAVHGFYRLTVAGPGVPADGPVLLVANHPNSLIDPAFIACAARRPVRFLAKAPLFTHPAVGFLVRGSGAIPVYRRVDDPGLVGRNSDTFRAAYAALAAGSAVALFPEGVSHDEPALMPLRTGAARIALGAVQAGAGEFPLIPVGIVLRRREVFRSEALVIVGEGIAWHDLAPRGPEDRDAVRELTDRVALALRRVTVNLERWEDEPLVATAEAVWAAEHGDPDQGPGRVSRMGRIADVLAALRARDAASWRPLARRLLEHRRKLGLLGLDPASLGGGVSLRTAGRWLFRRIPLVALGLLGLVGAALFWPPYRLIGWRDRRTARARDVRATHKLLEGTVIMAAWVVLLAAGAGALRGLGAGVAVLAGLPALGALTLWLADWWGASLREARRFLTLVLRPGWRVRLGARQRELYRQLVEINLRYG